MKKSIILGSFAAICMLWGLHAAAQSTTISTVPSFSNNNGSGLVTFNFENTNAYPIVITDVSTVLRSSGSSNFTIYYNTTPVSGPPGVVPTSASWTAAGTNTITSTLGSASNQTLEPVLSGLNLIIPGNTTYGIAVGGFVSSGTTGTMAYYTIPSSPATVTFSGGGCNIITGANISYGATSSTASASNTPRGFVGTITFEPLAGPNDAGIDSLISPALSGDFCSGSHELKVRLKNFGINDISNVTVNWSLNDILQTPQPQTFAPALPSVSSTDNWTEVSLGEIDFPYSSPVAIRVWTTQPNSVADTHKVNDTLIATITALREGVNVSISPRDTMICEGTVLTLDAGEFPANTYYIWNGGQVTRTIEVTESGQYDVKVLNSTGCSDRDTVTVTVAPAPEVNAITLIDNGDLSFDFNVLGAQNIESYTWDFGDGSTESNTGSPGAITHEYDEPGTYTVILTLYNECGQTQVTRVVTVQAVASAIIDANGLRKELKVYPNPGSDKVSLAIDGSINIKAVHLINALGRVVFSKEALNTGMLEIQVSDFAPGVYNLRIETDRGTTGKKITILK